MTGDVFTPAELPRTTLDYLRQSTFWRSQDGTVRPIRSMHTSHLRNLLPWLYRNAELFLLQEYADWSIASLTLQGEQSLLFVDQQLDHLMQTEPEVWLQQMPLTQAVVRELARREGEIEL